MFKIYHNKTKQASYKQYRLIKVVVYSQVLPQTQNMCCIKHKTCVTSNTKVVLHQTKNVLAQTHRKNTVCYIKHKTCVVSNTKLVLHQTQH